MRAKKIVNQSSDFLVRRTGSYRHKKAPPVRFQLFLVQLLLSEYAIKRLFNFPPYLFSVRALPWETVTQTLQ